MNVWNTSVIGVVNGTFTDELPFGMFAVPLSVLHALQSASVVGSEPGALTS
jgi:hypothetical protein